MNPTQRRASAWLLQVHWGRLAAEIENKTIRPQIWQLGPKHNPSADLKCLTVRTRALQAIDVVGNPCSGQPSLHHHSQIQSLGNFSHSLRLDVTHHNEISIALYERSPSRRCHRSLRRLPSNTEMRFSSHLRRSSRLRTIVLQHLSHCRMNSRETTPVHGEIRHKHIRPATRHLSQYYRTIRTGTRPVCVPRATALRNPEAGTPAQRQ